MTGVARVLLALHQAELRLEKDLLAASSRHRAEHEIHHVARDLARWSREHGDRLAGTGRAHGLRLAGPDDGPHGTPESPRERPGAFGEDPEPGLLLLDDLRGLSVAASGTSLYWEMLAQGAQATKDSGLLALASSCHPQTLRQVRWANTMIKNLAPQILSSPG
jgi:hypothetical protein